MARRGWVSAEIAPDTWRRLVVFDDGWVELAGSTRSLPETRRNLRSALVALGLFIGGLAVASALDVLGAPAVLVVAFAVVALGGLAYGAVRAFRSRPREVGAPREREGGVDSAAGLAGRLEGAVLVAADDVTGVEVAEDRASHVRHRVVVRRRDGSTRTYASPDKTLPKLLTAFRD